MEKRPVVQSIAIGTVLTALGMAGSFGVWYDKRQDVEHTVIKDEAYVQTEQVASESYRKSVELELRAIDIELKLLRTIEERRPLTADEKDHKDYLVELRAILLEAQRNEVK